MTVTEKTVATLPIRVLLVDDHPVVRAGLNSMLRKQSGLRIVGTVHGGREALEFLAKEPADVMLLDLRMPHMDGIDTLRALRQLFSPPKVVILSNFELDEEVLVKDTSRDEIITAIKAVHVGNTHFPKRIEERLSERKQRNGLSAREVEILELLSKGLTNKAIGQALGISKYTVRNHVNRILEKLEVCDRTEASTVAIEQGILPTFH
jgi:DNA-binding NarL/FixJ family response regulator